MNKKVLWMILIALLAASGIDSFGVGAEHLDIRKLVGSADIIVIADASEKTWLGPTSPLSIRGKMFPASQYATHLRVASLIKGDCPTEITVTYALPVNFLGYLPLQSGVRMFFLRRSGDAYHPADPYYPDLPASGGTTQQTRATNIDDAARMVLHELADVVSSAAAPPAAKFEVLAKDYAIPADDYYTSALKRGIATAATQQVREALQAHLLMRGDLTELPQATQALIHNTVTPEGRYGLLYAIGNWVKDARAVPALLPLTSAAEADTRTAAVEALWHIADRRTASTLVQHLDDPEYEVRYYTTRALADITGQNLWGPSIPEFKEHEQRYLQHWKQWAAANRQEDSP